MANLINFGTFYPRRLSEYVPAMQYSADLQLNSAGGRISFNAPVAPNGGYFIGGQSTAAAGSLQSAAMLNAATLVEPFGRNLVLQNSAAGAGSLVVDGWDYLNQPMSETFAYNGTTPVYGKKAFKYIRQVTFTLLAGNVLALGVGLSMGLPYKAIKVYTEEANGVPAALGNLINPDLTFPATLTTGDPKGLYTPATATNGTTVITATFDFANDVDANNNGGLMGVPHYTN